MDGDSLVEPELDAFSLFLPLPYRVAIILVLGMSSLKVLQFVVTSCRYMGVGAEPTLSFSSKDCEYLRSRGSLFQAHN